MSTKNFKCELDGRLFKTRRALNQHNATKHAAKAVPKQPVPRPRPRRLLPNTSAAAVAQRGTTAVFSGTDLIGSVTIPKGSPVGTQLLLWDVNPATLESTRVHQFASVFTRWRPRKLHLICIPGAGTFTPGSYVMGWVADPAFDVGSLDERIRRITTLVPNIMSTFGSMQRLVLPLDTTQKWYLTQSGVGVESDHGKVICVLAGMVGAENITLSFKLDWTIEFDSPDVPASREQFEAYPDPSYIPIFTDSVSDWASGTRLTFKHKEGGSVVPFIGLKDRVVYKPTRGSTIPYYKQDGSAATVSFFAKMRSPLYDSAMVCFETEENARRYASGQGGDELVIKFKQQGEYASPDQPWFVGEFVGDVPLLDLTHKPVAVLSSALNNVRLSNPN